MPSPINPASLSPEDQQALSSQAPQAQPTSQAINPASLSPADQQAAMAQQPTKPMDLSAEDMAELNRQSPDKFDIRSAANATQDPAQRQKLADAYNLYERTPVSQTLGKIVQHPIDTVGATLAGAAKGFGRWMWNYAKGGAHAAIGAAEDIASTPGQVIDYARGIPVNGTPSTLSSAAELENQEAQKPLAENAAATELAATGAAQMASGGVSKLGRAVGINKPLDQLTPDEKMQRLNDAAALQQQQGEIAKGHGESLPGLKETVTQDIEPREGGLNPENVSQIAQGEPLSWIGMGKAMEGIGMATGLAGAAAKATGAPAALAKVFPKTAGAFSNLPESAANAAQFVAGKTLSGVAATGKGASKVAEVAAPVVGAVVGATKGAEHLGPVGGAIVGYKAGQEIASKAGKIGGYFDNLRNIGQQISGTAPLTSRYAQLGKDIAGAIPGAAAQVGTGAAFDLGMASLADTPDQAQGVGFGTGLGLLGAARGAGLRAISGQIIAPKFYGTKGAIGSTGLFPALDAMHSAAMADASPGVQERLNAVRDFAGQAAGTTDVFLAKDTDSMKQGLLNAGVDEATADKFSKPDGFTTATLPDQSGTQRPVILVKNPDAAPHEAFHAVQNVLGEGANQRLDAFIKSQYSPEDWENYGKYYAQQLGNTDPLNWRAHILDASNWGSAQAKEQIYRRIANQYTTETGMVPDASQVQPAVDAAWEQAIADMQQRNPNIPPEAVRSMAWRDILSPEDVQNVSDKYISREIGAEHFDSLFKNRGPSLAANDTVLGKAANVLGNLTTALGGNPLEGRTTDIGLPINQDILGAVEGAAKSRLPEPVVQPKGKGGATPPAGAPPVNRGPVVTPEQRQQAAQDAQQMAAEAPTTPNAGGTKSVREILGTIAEAIAGKSGVKLNYSSAPTEPAAAITNNRPARRAMIEAFRSMPDAARALWEKTFFPDRVLKLKDGSHQVLGWSPEVFAANAHRLAGWLSDNPNRAALSPYEVDPKTRSFTPEAWNALYNDVKTFVGNQGAGRTGSGTPLVVPRFAREAGAFAPSLQRGEGALDQRKADVVNMLFGYKVPETPRITSGKMPLNVTGQEVSEATMPGRVEAPVRPRGSYAGEAAQKLGIQGREIQEVNPVRNELEAQAAKENAPLPSFIEAQQRLNLNRIKEVEHAPEQPEFRGNTLTLTAGFKPRTEAGKALEKQGYTIDRENYGTGLYRYHVMDQNDNEVANMTAKQKGPREAHVALVKVAPEHQNQGIAETLYRELATDLQDAGVTRLTGDVIHPAPLKIRDKLFGAPDVERNAPGGLPMKQVSSIISPAAQYKVSDGIQGFLDHLDSTSPEEWSQFIKNQSGGGAMYAYKSGAKAESPADVQALRSAREKYVNLTRAAMANRDIENAMPLASKMQAINEAHEAATGYSIQGDWKSDAVKEGLGQDFKHPVPSPAPEEMTAQAAVNKDDLKPNGSAMDLVSKIHKAGYERVMPDNPDYWNIFNHPNNPSQLFEMQRGDILDGNNDKKWHFRPMTPERASQISGAPELQRPEDMTGQFMHSLEGIKKMNDEEVARQQRQAETETTRWSSHTGNPKDGMVLHSAKLRNTMFVPPGKDAEKLQKRLDAAKNQAEKNSIIEGQFSTGKDDVKEGPYAEIFRNMYNEPVVQQGTYQPLTDSGKDLQDQGLKVIHRQVGDSHTLYAFKQGDTNPVGQIVSKGNNVIYSKNGPAAAALHDELAAHIGQEPGGITRKSLVDSGTEPDTMEPMTGQYKTKDKDWELQPAAGGFSKAWITPEGKPIQLGAQWHHDFLNANPALKKKYGINSSDEFKSREQALKAGFGRVNYDTRSGRLTVEAREKDWPDIREAAKKLVSRNLDKVDSMSVNLLDDKVKAVTDSDHRNLFDIPREERVDNLPLISAPGEVTKTSEQATPEMTGAGDEGGAPQLPSELAQRMQANLDKLKQVGFTGQMKPGASEMASNPTFVDELKRMREGGDGQTFTPSGDIWNPKKKDFDVVSVASHNLPIENLTPESVQNALAPYGDILARPGVAAGIFPFTGDDGKRMASVDVNALVPQKHRENTMRFAKDNNQIALWDAKKGEVVPTGGNGETQLKDPAEIAKAIPELLMGRDVAMHEGKVSLPALSGPQVAAMNRNDLMARYPEAVIPSKRDEDLKSHITDAPLIKGIKDEDEKVNKYGDRLVEEANKWKDTPEFKSAVHWYDRFSKFLKDSFGKNGQIFAEFLAATSPNTGIKANFGFAVDALHQFERGAFDRHIKLFGDWIKKLDDGSWEQWGRDNGAELTKKGELTEAAATAKWIEHHDILPIQSNGAKYGFHSFPVLRVLARKWLGDGGLKTQNFIQNLIGSGHEATIDMWADRTLRRLGYEGFQDRWRIMPMNQMGGIRDPDFLMGQKVFRNAAEKMGMLPDQLQAGMWFAEKKLWHDKGWGRLDLGDYMNEVGRVPDLRAKIEARMLANENATQTK